MTFVYSHHLFVKKKKQSYSTMCLNCIFNFDTFYVYTVSSFFKCSGIHWDLVITYLANKYVHILSLEMWLSRVFISKLSIYSEEENFLDAKCFSDIFRITSKMFLHNKITLEISVIRIKLQLTRVHSEQIKWLMLWVQNFFYCVAEMSTLLLVLLG